MMNGPLTSGVVDRERTSGVNKRVRIRPASLDDYDQIAALQLRNGLTVRPREEWEALWKGNPACLRGNAEWPMGWLLETPNAEIVGSISNIPLAYRFRGRDVRAAAFAGWAVDKPFRGYSIWLLSQALAQPDVELYLSTTMSPTSEAVFRALKWLPVPVGNWNRSAFWITGYQGFMSALLRAKSVPLARAVSRPFAIAAFCADRLRNTRLRASGRLDVELCSGFDERFDEFWQEIEARNPGALLAVRSRETLTWHFRSGLLRRDVWILAAHRGPRMIGYAVFDRADNCAFGLRRVRLVDFWAFENCDEVLRSALHWMLDVCRQQDIHVLEIVGWQSRPEFGSIPAPHHRNLDSWIYYYKVCDMGLRELLANPNAWLPSCFDGDASL